MGVSLRFFAGKILSKMSYARPLIFENLDKPGSASGSYIQGDCNHCSKTHIMILLKKSA